MSWYEIFNEAIHDLFMSESEREGREGGLTIRDKGKGLTVEGLNSLLVSSPEEVFELINKYASFLLHLFPPSARLFACFFFFKKKKNTNFVYKCSIGL